MTWRIVPGDCIEAMRAMDEHSVDAVVCDPPYGLGFMGKTWDSTFEAADMPMRRNGPQDAVNAGAARQGGRQRAGADFQRRMARDSRAFEAWCEAWAAEALRVLKPGGHLLAFGGTRTYHRLACAIEDAGFEIRDTIAWMYGSGFPKSLDVSKAIDGAAGATTYGTAIDGEPITPDAVRWQGWGTALKPAHEPVVVARKPLVGTVAGNVLAHGTGALNVDGCRIGAGGHLKWSEPRDMGYHGGSDSDAEATSNPAGRWPANVILDPEAAAILDEQTGELHSQDPATRAAATQHAWMPGADAAPRAMYGDTGGASRFLYVAKADNAERNGGLGADAGLWALPDTPERNDHPTVKPIDLMRWLVRLVTPPGGIVLDPFAGSGTTGCAAVLEGLNFIGIERDAEYVRIARARLAHWSTGQQEAVA